MNASLIKMSAGQVGHFLLPVYCDILLVSSTDAFSIQSKKDIIVYQYEKEHIRRGLKHKKRA